MSIESFHKELSQQEIEELDLTLDSRLLYDVVAPHLLGHLLNEQLDTGPSVQENRVHFILLCYRVSELTSRTTDERIRPEHIMAQSLEHAALKTFGYHMDITSEDINMIVLADEVRTVGSHVDRSSLRYDGEIDTDKIALEYTDSPDGIPQNVWQQIA